MPFVKEPGGTLSGFLPSFLSVRCAREEERLLLLTSLMKFVLLAMVMEFLLIIVWFVRFVKEKEWFRKIEEKAKKDWVPIPDYRKSGIINF